MRKMSGVVLVAAVLGGAAWLASAAQPSAEGRATSVKEVQPAATTKTAKTAKKVEPFVLSGCDDGKEASSTSAVARDARVREAAQNGLDFLTKSTVSWQAQHKCMGCHVQGVTGEALSVGFHHDYRIERDAMKTVFEGLLDLNGGLRTETGHAAQGGQLRPSSRAFGGASVARYDQWVSEEYSDDLISAAADLVNFQAEDGRIDPAYTAPPVASGSMQATYQAIQTWQQAYARSADDRWLSAIAKAEAFFQKTVDGWYAQPTTDVQHMNYAMLGLLQAGVGATEKTLQDLESRLREAQLEDGSWPLHTNQSHGSTLATGQSLYALRMLGTNDSDAAVAKATKWLIERQQKDGGWSASGAEKAEAMWAVLGLVTTAVLSVDVTGLENGQHVDGTIAIAAEARDNEGSGVRKIELAIDDIPTFGACGARMEYAWDTSNLEPGLHIVDITATNRDGKTTRRRLRVYAGDHFITGVGTKFKDGGTVVSFRDIAPTSLEHEIELQIFETKEEDGVPVASNKIFSTRQKGEQGAGSFFWSGKTSDGKSVGRGDYVGKLVFKDEKGVVRHFEEFGFVHDTYESQRRNYAQIGGSLAFEDDEAAANAEIELLDERGNVVRKTRSTASGKWRFRNIKGDKKYRVRVKKKGFEAREQELAPKPAEEAEVLMRLE